MSAVWLPCPGKSSAVCRSRAIYRTLLCGGRSVSRAGHSTPRSGGSDWGSPSPRVLRCSSLADAPVRAPFSTNVERVALALAHKGLERRVGRDLAMRTARRSSEVSGQGLVPVLVDGEEVVAGLRSDPALPGGELAGSAAVPARGCPARRARRLPRLVQRGLEGGPERDRGRAGGRFAGPAAHRRARRADAAARSTSSSGCSTAAITSSATSSRRPTARPSRS